MVPPTITQQTQRLFRLTRWIEFMMYFSRNIVFITRGLDKVQPEEINNVIDTIIKVIKRNEVESLEIFISGCARSKNKTIFWKNQEFKKAVDSIINKDVYENTDAAWNLSEWSNNNEKRIRNRNRRKRRLNNLNNQQLKKRKLNNTV